MPLELDDRGRALENDYFRRREQEIMEKMRAKLSDEKARTGAHNCPKCDGKLVETDFENIKIDVCDKCHGTWFDAGELRQVIHKDTESGWFGGLFK